ncbi:hypothetical protein NM688_g3442 [Phlebia brevispora]|uniref:Uncharacterized protein n=1 Tax=Phlebia brevispora TaxID=194682 RepID=A0ACC1T5Z1_9APHY|nr:hypothetical protein NM688_g3442 [Phlebia brevispora]
MPEATIIVEDLPVVFRYEDTGPPGGSSTYTTVVLVHGLIFHGRTFKRMSPYAASHNLRFISVNMRDYPGSSAYTPSELQMLANPEYEAQEAAVLQRGNEIATFLKYVIEHERIPAFEEREGARTGGIALLTWSMGNVFSMTLLGNIDSLGEETRSLLHRYLRSVVIYDTPYVVVGAVPPEGIYHPLSDRAVPLERRPHHFMTWVSTYYEPVDDISSMDLSVLAKRRAMHDISNAHETKPLIDRMSVEDIEDTTDPAAFYRSGMHFRNIPREIYWSNVQRALFDTKGSFAHVDTLVLWCDMSPTISLWAAKSLHERLVSAQGEDKKARKVKLLKLEHANHFVHWEEPERMVRVLVEHL